MLEDLRKFAAEQGQYAPRNDLITKSCPFQTATFNNISIYIKRCEAYLLGSRFSACPYI